MFLHCVSQISEKYAVPVDKMAKVYQKSKKGCVSQTVKTESVSSPLCESLFSGSAAESGMICSAF